MAKTLQLLVLISITFGAVTCQAGGWGGEMGGGGGGLDLLGHGASIFDMLFGLFTDSPVPQNVPVQSQGMSGPGGLPIDINLLQSSGGQPNQNAMSYLPGTPRGFQRGLQGGLQAGGFSGQEMLLAQLLGSGGRRGGSRGSGGEGEGGGGGEGGAGGGGEGGAGGAGGEEGGAGPSSSGMISLKDLLQANMLQSQSGMNLQRMGMGSMGMDSLGMGNMGMRNMGMGNMGMRNMGMGNLGMGRRGMGNLGMRNMGMGNLGMGNMGMGRLGMGNMGMGRMGMGNMGLQNMGMLRSKAAGGGGEEGGAAGGAGGEGGAGGGEGGGAGAGGEGAGAGAGGEGGAAAGGGGEGGRSGMEWALMALKNPQFRRMSGNMLRDFTGSIFKLIDGAANTMSVPLGGQRQSTSGTTRPKNSMVGRNQRFRGQMAGTKLSQDNIRSIMMNNELPKAMSGIQGSARFPPYGILPNNGLQSPNGGMTRVQRALTPTGSKSTGMAAGVKGGTGGASVNGQADSCPEFPYVVHGGEVIFKDINLNCQLSVDLQSTSVPPRMTKTGVVPLTTASPPTTSGTSGSAPQSQNASPLAQMQSKLGGDAVAMCPPWKVWRRDREIHIETVPSRCHIIVMSMKGIPGIQGSNSVQVRFANRGGQTPRSS